MPNSPGIPLVPCCPENGGGDLMPLLLVVIVLLAGHIAIQEFKKRRGKPEMKNFRNIAIVAALVVAAGIVFALKPRTSAPAESAATAETTAVALPRLLELGADKCIPCKQMAPILADLKTTYAGQLEVDFIDVWKNPDASERYGVRVIPLQIFFDAEGQELFRHEGFFAKDDILAKWRDLGYEFQ
jgi:thioredoxin 1